MSDETDELAGWLLTDDEIEFYLKGDRKDIDKLILQSINRLTSIIVPHTLRVNKRQAEWDKSIDDLGGVECIRKRALYVDDQRERALARTAALRKISESTVLWALLLFIVFLSSSVMQQAVFFVKKQLGN